MLAIRDLQCFSYVVEYAVVTQFGVGDFSAPRSECFYGKLKAPIVYSRSVSVFESFTHIYSVLVSLE